jgi:EAL domain-containing protein (putative c-di-GMP-specific phosphodiesterase class I)
VTVCGRCEVLPEVPDAGQLWLAAPIGHSQSRLRAFLLDRGLTITETDGVIAVSLPSGRLPRLAVDLVGAFSHPELVDTRCLLSRAGATLTISDLARTQSLASLIARSQGGWLIEMMREDRLTTFFQPIVRTHAPAEVHAFECLLRGRERDGAMASAAEILRVARDAELLFPLDRAARLRAIRSVVEHQPTGKIFLNFAPSSIYDPAFCLRTTVSAIEESGIAPARFVFEVNEADHVADLDHLLGIVRYYRRRGFGIALDDLGAGYGSLELLARLQPDYVKIDISLIRGVDHDHFRARILDRLLELTRDLRLFSIVEGVETAAEWRWARDHGADFAQGFLFARPAAVPPTVQLPDAA